MAENAERNLRLFRELITCPYPLQFWTYDTRFSLVYTNCQDGELMGMIFLAATKSIPPDTDAPMLLTTNLGFSWAVNLERDGNGLPIYYHVVGPAITSRISMDSVKEAIARKNGVSYSLARAADEILARIPSIPVTRMLEYSVMLHYCITEEKLAISDVLFPESGATWPESSSSEGHTENPHGTWIMEERLMKLVEEGNLNFREESAKLVGGVVPADLGGGDLVRHYKNLMIAFTASCCRAAIRGGLSPAIAYDLSDKYIRSVESCNTLPEMYELIDAMQEDYVRRVHQARTGGLSPAIQHLCDYIQIHAEEELSLETVSRAAGYSPAWLSSKFRKETGKTVSQYITEQRMERAKALILEGNQPMQEIAERLHYKTPSHFGAVFRQQTGMSPGEFRAKRGREEQ